MTIGSRAELARTLVNMSGSTMATLERVFGYAQTRAYSDYLYAYKNYGIARRIIDAIVDFTWRSNPEIIPCSAGPDDKNKALVEAVEVLQKSHDIYGMAERADRLACIGQYSVIVIGSGESPTYDPATNRHVSPSLAQPMQKGGSLSGFTVHSEKQAEIDTWETAPGPRYGLPKTYKIHPTNEKGGRAAPHTVHHSRVIHVADGIVDNLVYGTPKLECAYNYIQDLLKVVGASAEMFWLGAYQGLVFSMAPREDMLVTDPQYDDMKRELEEYALKLRRHIITSQVDVKSLPGVTPNPQGIVDVLIQLISAASQIPTRILLGSEQGQLASGTDRDIFLSMIAGRRITLAENVILRPLFDRLIEYGMLPSARFGREDYEIEWRPLIEQTQSEKITDAGRVIGAARQFVGSAGEIREVLTVEEFRELHGFDAEIPPTDHPAPEGDYEGPLSELPAPGYEDPAGNITEYLPMRRKKKRTS